MAQPVRRRRRRRRRLNKRFVFLVAALVLILILLIVAIVSCTGPSAPAETQPPVDTTPKTGWMEEEGKAYYLLSDGTRATGWLEVDGKRYLLSNEGYPMSGWQEENGSRFYILENGQLATGTVTIEGVTHHFTSTGAPILLVNPWNPVPDGYEPDLVPLSTDISVEGSQVDRSCYDALLAMINDCNKECPKVCVASSYRTHEYQTNSYNRKVQYYLDKGYSQADAEKEAATIIARPGTSEHQLGLAVDIIDTRIWDLVEEQETLPAQQWLMENSWKYGFILRYPKNKIDVTGIIYEPWHYRYVGVEVAKELHDSGLTLEEYLLRLS